MLITLNTGVSVEIFSTEKAAPRLKGTCFRGSAYNRAGNFFRWEDFQEFIEDPEIIKLLIPILEESIFFENFNTTHRVELELDSAVGWDRVVGIDELSPEDLKGCAEMPHGYKATVLRLPLDRIKAPLTSIITMVFRMSFTDHWEFSIYDLKPGEDVGEFKGFMLEKCDFVWLSWANIGEEIEDELSEVASGIELLSA